MEMCAHKNMYSRMFMADFNYNRQSLNSRNVKTIQRFINTKMDKEIIVYLYNGILLNNKKEYTFDW